MRNLDKLIFLSCASLALSSCASYKKPTVDYYISDMGRPNQEVRIDAANHPLYKVVPRHFEQIKPYDLGHITTWVLFGNEDDGIFGEEYESPYYPKASYANAFKWTVFRNPLANFKTYVIGTGYLSRHNNFSLFSIDKTRGSRFMKKEQNPTVFGTGPNTFQFQLNDFKPFVSFKLKLTDKSKFDFCLGWKERGNFGFKFRPFVRRDGADF
jgi:hypothetical protein